MSAGRIFTAVALSMTITLGAGNARAEIIQLKNGKTLMGEIVQRKEGKIAVKTESTQITLPENAVANITIESPAEKHLSRARMFQARGLWMQAREALTGAEQAGGDKAAVSQIGSQIDRALADENKPMAPKAALHYTEALHLLDKTLTNESAEEMYEAQADDPQNMKILRQLMRLEYARYLSNKEMTADAVIKQANLLTKISPEDPEATRVIQQITNHESSIEEQRQQEIDELMTRIHQAYQQKSLRPQLLDDIRRVRALNPSNDVLSEIGQIESELGPLITAQLAQKEALANMPAANTAMDQPKAAAAGAKADQPQAKPAGQAKPKPAAGGGGKKGGGGGGKKGGGKKK